MKALRSFGNWLIVFCKKNSLFLLIVCGIMLLLYLLIPAGFGIGLNQFKKKNEGAVVPLGLEGEVLKVFELDASIFILYSDGILKVSALDTVLRESFPETLTPVLPFSLIDQEYLPLEDSERHMELLSLKSFDFLETPRAPVPTFAPEGSTCFYWEDAYILSLPDEEAVLFYRYSDQGRWPSLEQFLYGFLDGSGKVSLCGPYLFIREGSPFVFLDTRTSSRFIKPYELPLQEASSFTFLESGQPWRLSDTDGGFLIRSRQFEHLLDSGNCRFASSEGSWFVLEREGALMLHNTALLVDSVRKSSSLSALFALRMKTIRILVMVLLFMVFIFILLRYEFLRAGGVNPEDALD